MNAWYFEDFTPGAVIPSHGRTITETDVLNFAGVSGDFNVLHVDRTWAADTPFGEPIAHGLLGLAIVSGLMHQTGVINGTIVAFLGLTWKFVGPVRFGDTIRPRMTVRAARETSKPDRGIVVLDFEVTNQRGEPVQAGEFTLMMRRRA